MKHLDVNNIDDLDEYFTFQMDNKLSKEARKYILGEIKNKFSLISYIKENEYGTSHCSLHGDLSDKDVSNDRTYVIWLPKDELDYYSDSD